jgi:murein DD-endopeptidase MepM/ murein hydrolase activator NlpD
MRPLLSSLLSVLLLSCGLWSCSGDGPGQREVLASAGSRQAPPAEPVLTPGEKEAQRFAIADTVVLEVTAGEVRSGQSLSHILAPAGVSAAQLHGMATDQKAVFDVRRMKAGNDWSLFSGPDGSPRHFAYAISSKEYVVFDLTDQGRARRGQFPSETRRGYVEGEVHGSLYQVLEDEGHSTTLALAMSQVYAWTIDFSRIQAGDRFRILYDRDWVGGSPVGMPRILAAEFVHRGRNFPAYAYDQGDGVDHFDETGASLRKAFLKAPVEFSRISSRFDKKRFHPVLKKVKAHLGTDYAAPHGTPIVSVGDGVVVKASYTKGNGKYVKVRHNSTYTTQYLHMSRRNVKEGQAVRQGDVIGYVGSTGLATGPHVCFRFWKNGQQVDHLREEFPPSTPIEADHEADFARAVDAWREEMARFDGRSLTQLADQAP